MRTKKTIFAPVLALLMLVGTATGAAAVDGIRDNPPESSHDEFIGTGVRKEPGGSDGNRVCPTSPTYVAGVDSGCTNSRGMWWSGSCWAKSITDSGTVIDDAVAIFMRDPGYFEPGGAGWDDAGGAGKSSGTIYFCFDRNCPDAAGMCHVVDRFWGPGATVSPGEVAERAVAAMDLRAPQIGMTGGDPPDGMQIVGVPAWMWAADPGDSTTGPITRSAADGGISVTATGVLEKTVWRMGDGVTITCAGANAAGTPWQYGYGGLPSPTCGYTYNRTSAYQPDEAFTVTVTAHWRIDWSGGGESGVVRREVSRSIPKRVGEVQSILVPNPNGP
ncbi:MAG: hypothetical protein LBU50_02950 [Cellulomonas sp.]|jgi:hypothetical protein|nr:hypothetical protein [Cellulomonas sp.]